MSNPSERNERKMAEMFDRAMALNRTAAVNRTESRRLLSEADKLDRQAQKLMSERAKLIDQEFNKAGKK